MFSVSLMNADHIRRYSISFLTGAGWEVTHQQDGELTRRSCYHDWHRVERARAAFALEVSKLTERGWTIVDG
jgi:hypothetical protein